MSGDLSLALQKFVYETLSGDADLMEIATGIFDYVPPFAGGVNEPKMPYIVIGEDNIVDTSDKCGTMTAPRVTIHLWDENETKVRLKEMMQIVHDLLHSKSGSIDGVNISSINHEQSNTLQEAEGVIFHGIMVFTFYMEG